MELSTDTEIQSKSNRKDECKHLSSGQCWEFYTSFFKNNYIPMLIVNPSTGIIVDANDAACSYYGYSHEEFKSLRISQINTAPPDEIMKAMHQVQSHHKNEFLFNHRLKNGETRSVKVISGSIKLNGDDLLFSVINDITDKIKTEEAMGVLQKIADTSGEVIFTTDEEGIFRYVNPEFCALYDYKPEEVIGKVTPRILKSGLLRTEDYAEVWKILKSKHVFRGSWYNKTRNGRLLNIEGAASPILDSKGEISGFLALQRDVTERVRIENALKESESLLKNLIDFLPDATFAINSRHEVIIWNRAMEVLTGIKAEDMLFKSNREYAVPFYGYNRNTIADLLIEPDPESEKEYEVFQKSDGEIFAESIIENSKREKIHIWIAASTLYGSKGEIIGAIESIRDITDRKKFLSELENARKKAEESDLIKTTLLKNMSHEFRTPVNGIIGMSKMLMQESAEQEVIKAAENINQSAHRLFRTLKSVLDLSYLSNPDYHGNLEEKNLSQYLDGRAEEWKAKAAEKGLDFQMEIRSPNVYVNADVYMLNCITDSIIDNALKYTVAGSVKVTLESEIQKSIAFAIIRIEDTGIGISEKDLGLIFNDFTQISSGYGRSYEGCGLGLTVASKMAKRMGGRIEVKSRINEGSVFSILFQQIVHESKEAQEVITKVNAPLNKDDRKKNSRKRILVVEDNYINALLVRHTLKEDYDVDSVADGMSAIEKANRNAYDLIVMDINLGKGINGIEAMQRIREIDGYKVIPIAAVTGYAMPEDEKYFTEEGFTFYLPKPYEKFELLRIINQAFNSEPGREFRL